MFQSACPQGVSPPAIQLLQLVAASKIATIKLAIVMLRCTATTIQCRYVACTCDPARQRNDSDEDEDEDWLVSRGWGGEGQMMGAARGKEGDCKQSAQTGSHRPGVGEQG